MMGALLSNSTPHHVVVASPFQLGWKAVAVRSKQLPQGLLGGAAPALDEGEPVEPDDEPEDEPDEADDEAAEPDEEAVALAEAEAEAEACELPDEPDDDPAEEPAEELADEPDDEPDEEPAEEPALDEADEPAEEPAEAPPPCLGLVCELEELEGRFLFLHTFLRWGEWATMARLACWCLLLSDLASASGALEPNVASTASDATAKMVERMLSMDRKGREHSCLCWRAGGCGEEVLTSGMGAKVNLCGTSH